MFPSRSARGRRLAALFYALLLAVSCPLAPAADAGSGTLTTAAQVRALSEAQARRALPVRLHGVFMGSADPQGIAFVVQDETEGIYVQGPADLVAHLGRGDLLDIEGVTDPGGFAPYVVAQTIRKVGQGPIPEPVKVTLDQLNAGQMDAKWIEISGIVRSVEPKEPSDLGPPPPGTRYTSPSMRVSPAHEGKVKMKLAAGDHHVVVEADGEFNPEALVDAEVKVRGLCFNLHNHKRQFVRPFVQVPQGEPVVVTRPPPTKPFDAPLQPVASLLQFDQLAGAHGHRVHVRGVVVYHRPGVALWVRDRDHSLRAGTTQTASLQPGDQVDVLGFPAVGEYSAVLEDAVFRKVGSEAPPAPRVLTDVAGALQNDADLVQLDAVLTDVRRSPDSVALTLEWRQTTVRAQVRIKEPATTPSTWLPGSVVRVAGVCSVLTDEVGPLGGLWEPHSFQLLLRSPDDLAVLKPPPWWSAERIVWVLASFLVLALVAVAVVMAVSRRRVKDQEHRRAMAEAEFTAILSERNRVARDIHDTLSQSLGAISVQLELARMHAHEISVPARNHLAAALKFTRGALAEARESIWNMRSHVLERHDLGEALRGILNQMTEGTGITGSMRVEGDRRRLPPVVENNLLRMGQEAITNATKHAQPHRIDVVLSFQGRAVELSVQDDGVGFDATATVPVNEERRSFGLVGMRERVELLGGTIAISSTPGSGTRVVVRVSV